MTDNTDFYQMLERMIKAGSRRTGNADEHDLAHFASLKNCFEYYLKSAVQCQVDQGKSWADIGLALGISRQAAFKRFSR